MKTMRYHKPDPLLLLAFFVGIGVLATSVVQAAEPLNVMADNQIEQEKSADWLQSFWNLDLSRKIKNWKPMISVEPSGADGLGLVRPFGTRGPELRVLNSLPKNVQRNLRAGGDNRVGAFGGEKPDAYLFLEKRW